MGAKFSCVVDSAVQIPNGLGMDLLQRLSAGPRAYILVGLITLLAALPGLIAMPALDRDESRFAQASKQMLESGDFIRIQYQTELRNKKPAGIHWLQAGAVGALPSEHRNVIWAYRLPSLVGAVLASMLCLWCGWPLVGRPAAFLGAAFFASGLLLTSEAHIAKTDAVLVALTLWALGVLGRLYLREGPAARWVWMLWASLGFAFLIKGPVTLWVVGLTLAGLALMDRKRGWARVILDKRGIALFAIIVLPWFLWVQIATGGAFIEGAVGKDLKDKLVSASEGHGGQPLYHLAFLTTHFFPATLLLLPGLALAWHYFRARTLETMGDPYRAGILFLLALIIPNWLFFELLPTKLSHYILPIYPALALLCGAAGVRLLAEEERPSLVQRVSLAHFVLGGSVLLALSSPPVAAWLASDAASNFQTAETREVLASWRSGNGFALWAWGLGLAAVIGTVLAGVYRRIGVALSLAILAGVLVGGHVRGVFLPSQGWVQATPTGLRALEAVGILPGVQQVHVIGYSEPSLVFELGTETQIPPRTQVGLEAGAVWLINLERASGPPALAQLENEAASAGRCVQRSTPHYALNYSNGDPIAFTALRILDGPC